mmetsp:Transcript_24921/g.40358  ORF Transcript_24921/g.40358 Transcript_24921/m.40358 type:complete len:124 (-) Transcript_24921:170-541(-)
MPSVWLIHLTLLLFTISNVYVRVDASNDVSDVDSTSRALNTEKARLISANLSVEQLVLDHIYRGVTFVLFIVVLLLVIITTLSVAWFFFQRRKQNNDKKKQFESVQTRIKISSDHYSEDENKA